MMFLMALYLDMARKFPGQITTLLSSALPRGPPDPLVFRGRGNRAGCPTAVQSSSASSNPAEGSPPFRKWPLGVRLQRVQVSHTPQPVIAHVVKIAIVPTWAR